MIFSGLSKDLPFYIDGDEQSKIKCSNGFVATTIRGNALFNFHGDPETIKDWVKNKNINPFFTAFDRINHVGEDNETETLLFTDVPASCRMVADKRVAQLSRVK